jgi:hypothetical protein
MSRTIALAVAGLTAAMISAGLTASAAAAATPDRTAASCWENYYWMDRPVHCLYGDHQGPTYGSVSRGG